MALDTLGGIRSISVPTWLKLLIFVIVLAVLTTDVGIAWVAVTHPQHKDWFTVSVQLVGSLLPLLLVILLLAFSNRGPETIRRKTSSLLLRLAPETITSSLVWSPQFNVIEKAQASKTGEEVTRVEVAHRRGDFCCIYRITFSELHTRPGKKHVVFLAVELKVRQVNMHLCVPRNAFESYCAQSGLSGYEAFRKAFDHTLSGAERAGCKVNAAIYHFSYAEDLPQTGVVVYRELSDDFFTDPAEQLYWAQDMVTMLKGFVEEGLSGSQPVPWFPEAASSLRAAATSVHAL
jgi:hypothetical protein